ncbi:hypothetical protein WICPIJ_005162 [Wickerhamomyces pijperi]|uniref:RING-type domain-containing protein n=1 Tax=Wickerhamomyces pijperi TaxID=599730 RepID=A0A9P8Q426_WICPI|nr:hypothetical protein WICPIJ_005162 [Wickerhamomyces pijperi]
MSNKYNPNASSFVPNTKSLTNSSSSSQSLNSVVSQKNSNNMSSHNAPPPAITNTKSKNSGNKKRESKGPAKPNTQNKPRTWFQDHQHHDVDKFDVNIEDEVIRGNFKARGRRGQISINHLLDFSLPSRDLQSAVLSQSSAPVRRRRRSSNNDDKIHLTGAAFINANYRFVVDYRHDYRGQTLDPNLGLDNLSILRVIVPKGHNCPICLTDEIVAPRMISCGHIFCNTCLLSFLDSETIKKKDEFKRFKDCPLCAESVKSDEILPVVINQTDERFETPQIGHDVIMKLMAKPIDNILPIPHSLNLNHSKIGSLPWYCDTELYPYSRLMKGGLKFLVNAFEEDKAAILKQYEEDLALYNDDGKYVNKAVREIDHDLASVKKSFNDDYNEPNELLNSINNLSISKNESGLNDGNCYFFYQTCFHSTTRYFLSSFDVKILMATYGSYSNFPTTLLLKVDNISYGHMVTEQTLKRYKYFNHLPMGTEFAFIEVDWTDLITPEVYQQFAKELAERKKKLLNKTKREDRDKKRFENEQELKAAEFYRNENNGWGYYDYATDHTIAIDDEESTPALSGRPPTADANLDGAESTTTAPVVESVSTVWGTSIPKSQITQDDYIDGGDDWDADELIRQSRESLQSTGGGKKKKKGKKRLIVLSSTNGRGF